MCAWLGVLTACFVVAVEGRRRRTAAHRRAESRFWGVFIIAVHTVPLYGRRDRLDHHQVSCEPKTDALPDYLGIGAEAARDGRHAEELDVCCLDTGHARFAIWMSSWIGRSSLILSPLSSCGIQPSAFEPRRQSPRCCCLPPQLPARCCPLKSH